MFGRLDIVEGKDTANLANVFEKVETNYDNDCLKVPAFSEQAVYGKIDYYNQSKGYGFISITKEMKNLHKLPQDTFFFHFRGHAKPKPVLNKNEYKILLLPDKIGDTKAIKKDKEVAFITKESDQGLQARMWCFKDKYDEVFNGTKSEIDEAQAAINSSPTYRVCIFRDLYSKEKANNQTKKFERTLLCHDYLVIFNGNNLDALKRKIEGYKRYLSQPDTYLNYEVMTDGEWKACENPLAVAEVAAS